MPTLRLDIVIVGAGLGGLAAAATLLQRGHRVRVAEQSPVLGEVGAGIQMSANAMKVLDRLDLRARLDPLAVRPKAFEFRRFNDGELLHRLRVESGAQIEAIEHLHRVGAHLDACTDLAEHRRLFGHAHAMAALQQRRGRGQPAEAGADDRNVQAWRHRGTRSERARGPTSVGRDALGLDHLRPALRIALDQCTKLLRAAVRRRHALGLERVLHFG